MNKLNDIYMQWTIRVGENELREILVGQLSELGIEGFVEEADVLQASALMGSVDVNAVSAVLAEMGQAFSVQEVQQQNWNAQWESSFEPVMIGQFAAVRASFHPSVSGVVHEIVITPKMSFGTGHHATAWLCMQAMSTIDFVGKTVIDFGTGTGVLAILASKLGAEKVWALDNDDWSITNATENVAVNGIINVELILADNLEKMVPADIMLANINRHIILAHLVEIKEMVKPGGLCLLSGLLVEDRQEMVEQMETNGFDFQDFTGKNGWISLVFMRTGVPVN